MRFWQSLGCGVLRRIIILLAGIESAGTALNQAQGASGIDSDGRRMFQYDIYWTIRTYIGPMS